ncbi:MAG: sigma-54 dependent transcriptional regulator [candidate division KSB1 bacterium]|nr:sigma-54 dependent transcriptional regulator [candidate division KSB1 bacterium]MDZ7345178.1 sigma-54 dependent transcriptional regulator [candidate division KSB1 bacterium]
MNEPLNILIVDDDEMIRHTYALILTEHGYDVTTAADGADGLEQLQKRDYAIVFVDYRMPDMDGLQFLQSGKELAPRAEFVLVTAFSSIETAVEAIKLGAFHYLDKPSSSDKLVRLVKKIEEERSLYNIDPESGLHLTFNGAPLTIIGKSERIRRVYDLILKAAPTDSTVLILGESGTGKELFAKAVHAAGPRRDKPFVVMDCSTLVETLFESELFGHVKGSFTGATETKHGAFEIAHSGTFFFDEVGNIPLSIQAKILRTLQEKEIRRIGSTQTIHVDVRVIAAANIDLKKAVEEGRFREDLYYRLNVIPIELPPLRERREDIPLLANYFLKQFKIKRRNTPVEGFSDEAIELFLDYPWPGNIRELQNAVERALVVEESNLIRPASLPPHIRRQVETKATEVLSLADVEREHIRKTLAAAGYNISRAARQLGIDRKTLYEKIRRYGLDLPSDMEN